MNTPSHPRLLSALLFATLLVCDRVNGAAKANPGPPPPAVGKLGRREALVLEGNESFTQSEILRALSLEIEFHTAGYPTSPLATYVRWLEHKIALGYQHAGFPDVAVKAAADDTGKRIKVSINEGMRFRCGDIVLSGAPALTNAAVKQKILDKLAGLEPRPAAQLSTAPVVWNRGQGAAFDEGVQQQIDELIGQALQELDYFQTEMKAWQKTDRTRGVADLHVEFLNAGIKGVIEDIEVSGLRTNTPEQVLKFLNLERGMEMHASLLSSLPAKLAESGRFLHHEVKAEPKPQVGKFKLVLDLEEAPDAPPLGQALSPESIAMLKFHRWLMDWQKRPEDFVCSLSLTTAVFRLEGEILLNASGFAIAVRQDRTNATSALKYAFVATPELAGAYSAWRRSKYVCKPTAELSAYFTILPNPDPSAESRYNVSVGGGFNPAKNQPGGGQAAAPFRLNLDLHPSVFLVESKTNKAEYILTNGVLTFAQSRSKEAGLMRLQIDAATGRLLQCTLENDDPSLVLRLRAEEGRFAQLLNEIAAATAGHHNDYVTNGGWSPLLQYLIADLLGSQLIEGAVKMIEANESAEAAAAARLLMPAVQLAREVVSRQVLAKVFEPLSPLGSDASAEDDDDFTVPMEPSAETAMVNPMMALFGAMVLVYSDQMLTRDSWPWTLARSAGFNVAGQPRYAHAEADRLMVAEDIGPLGCLAAARSVGKTDPKLARALAERGRLRLKPSDLRKDYDVLVRSNSMVSEVLANSLGLFETVSDEQVASFTAKFPPADAKFFHEMTRVVRSRGDASAASAAWPVFERNWDSVIFPKLDTALNHFLPQVSFLTNSEALYARGVSLIAADAVLQDFDEAAQCFRKAAAQGHPGAQLNLGLLYENGRGVERDPVQAMNWYRKAADQKEMHASCRIGDLYRDGNGTTMDLEEAGRWYRIDAGRGCSSAQFNLARFAERQNQMPEALNWYRMAATNGQAAAQSQLGDLLSDGLFTAPDYVEAAQWLTLAVRGNDKVAEVSLRRVKAKLSTEQFSEAQQRANAISERLEAQEKERQQKAGKKK